MTYSSKTENKKTDSLFKVCKIKSLKNFYIIYLEKNDTLYKVISKKEEESSYCNKIKVRKYYQFNLIVIFPNKFIIDEKEYQTPYNVECLYLDKFTTVCLERKISIYYLHMATNLHGLCLKPPCNNSIQDE